MSADKTIYRIFLSSPGDVEAERGIVRAEIGKVFADPEFAASYQHEIISWDDPDTPSPLLANQTPQAALRRQMVEPADCDLVIVIFWGRMGTPLPVGQFRKKSGEPYLSGTEWEFENALHSKKQPNILLYRRVDSIALDPDSADYDYALEQQGLVSKFFKRFSMEDGSLRGLYQKYRGTAEFGQQLRNDIRGILRMDRGERGDGVREVPLKPTWQKNPYVGLAPYDEDHAEVFFGREREIERLVEKLNAGVSCISAVGASGCGKSSLVLAGIVPRLKAQSDPGAADWTCHVTRPSSSDFLAGFSKAAQQEDMDRVIESLLPVGIGNSRLLYVVDQAEELLKADGSQLVATMTILRGIIESPHAALMLTCRADLFGDVIDAAGSELYAYLQESAFMLTAPGSAELMDIIRKPAQIAGIEVEDAVVGKILENVENNRGALPLVSYLLGELYRTAGDSQVFTLEAYAATGGVDAVVSTSAEKVYAGLAPSQAVSFPDVFSELLSFSRHNVAVRENCAMSMFRREDQKALIAAFVEARLLTVTERPEGQAGVEITHESLISNWGRLSKLASEKSEQIKWRQNFRAGVERWVDCERAESGLLLGEELDKTRNTVIAQGLILEGSEKEYLDASVRRRESIANTTRRLVSLQFGVSALALVMILSVLLMVLGDSVETLEQQMTDQSASNTQALATALASQDADPVLLELTLSAQFDTGRYELIELVGPDGQVMFRRVWPGQRSWVRALIDLEPKLSETAVQSGWQQLGTVSLMPSYRGIEASLESAVVRAGIFIVVFLVLLAPSLVFAVRSIRKFQRSVS